MEYRLLGKTGIRVSRLCFGVLTIGPLQAHLPLPEGVSIMRYAVERGVNFFDTAELYGTYPYLRELLHQVKGKDLVIASKSYAVSFEEMKRSVEKARRELDRDVIDIFLLHEQESELTLKGHRGALEYLIEAKSKGIIKAVGISTHHVAGVKAATAVPEIEVIHPLLNYTGLGIRDGSVEDMVAAIVRASAAGKGVYLMKPLGGGNLISKADTALKFAFSQQAAAAVAVGMKSREEVEYNVLVASGLPVPEKIRRLVSRKRRRLHIEDWCEGCGECVQACPQEALFVGPQGKVQVREELCVLCGYCAAACPHFYIRVF
ncbi:MAG: Aldo/keto reductase [Thermoanaerobacterales bacterium 50_218]|nr:MAG: Aldo/keto reductase [Thermoanaerobacterales bacterium 50_218]HAA89330.1 aldo/keto reductase [Peptococcaceae bacterium]